MAEGLLLLKAIQIYQFYHSYQALNKFQIAEFLLRQAENSAKLQRKYFSCYPNARARVLLLYYNKLFALHPQHPQHPRHLNKELGVEGVAGAGGVGCFPTIIYAYAHARVKTIWI